jgi:hypothetical protein
MLKKLFSYFLIPLIVVLGVIQWANAYGPDKVEGCIENCTFTGGTTITGGLTTDNLTVQLLSTLNTVNVSGILNLATTTISATGTNPTLKIRQCGLGKQAFIRSKCDRCP